MKKIKKSAIIIDLIIFVLFSCVTLIPPIEKNVVFWVSYLFGTGAILVQIFVIHTAFYKYENLTSKFYGFPIAKIGFSYMCLQLILSFVFMIVSSLIGIAVWIPCMIYVVIAGVYAIAFITDDEVRTEIVNQDKNFETSTQCMQSLRSIVYPLANQIDDEECSMTLKKLAEEFRYSDPVSNDAIKEIENDLTIMVNELQGVVTEGDKDVVKELSKRITITLTERNRLCKINKNMR